MKEGGDKKKGRLFLFEGIDGSGKTTQVRLASANLTANGIRHAIVDMPGKSRLSVEIRRVLNSCAADGLSAYTEALLHFAMIRNSLEEFVLPALQEGNHVLMDRSHLSTAAYQGASGDEIFAAVIESAGIWLSSLRPTRIFYFDIDPKIAEQRIRLRGDYMDRYDSLPIETKISVKSRYDQLQDKLGGTFSRIDAERDASAVSKKVLAMMLSDITANLTTQEDGNG